MGQNPTKAAGNIYCQKRKEAAKFNDRLNSREGASELLGVSPSTLADYELNYTKIVPVDVVLRMSDIYGSPELLPYYCHEICPLGDRCMPDTELKPLDRAALQFLAAIRSGDSAGNQLLNILADGKITAEEIPQLKECLEPLDQIMLTISELRLRVKKEFGL